VFILPKQVIKLIEYKLNKFLWGGSDSKTHAKVAWEKICAPKKEGGLGIKSIEVWNKASMMNHIWNLFIKAGLMWVAWVEANCLKRRSFWHVSVPVSCSWSWKKLLQLRDLAKKFIWFKVGDGSRVFLWLDHWHPASYLLDQYGYIIVYDSGFSLNTKLAAVIKNGNWFWAIARSNSLVDIQSQLHEVALGYIDEPVSDSRNGKYTCVETWGKLRVSFPVVN